MIRNTAVETTYDTPMRVRDGSVNRKNARTSPTCSTQWIILPVYVMYILLWAMNTLPMHALNESIRDEKRIMKNASWTSRLCASPTSNMYGARTDTRRT